jgi:hypothetical protein
MLAAYEGGGGGGLSRLLEHRRLVQEKQGLCLDVSGCLCGPLDVCVGLSLVSRLSSLVALSLVSLSLVSRLSRRRCFCGPLDPLDLCVARRPSPYLFTRSHLASGHVVSCLVICLSDAWFVSLVLLVVSRR